MTITASNATLPTARSNLGLGTANTPAFAGLGLGGATSPVSDTLLRIGTVASSTPDPAMIFGRLIDTVSNGHGITDATDFTGADPGGSYNSYDARPTIRSVGTDPSSHYAAFQSRPVINSSTTVSNVKSYTSHAELNGTGDITEFYGLHTLEPDKNSSGVITRYYGARFETVASSIATESWGIYQVGDMTSAFNYFGSPLGLGKNRPTAALHFGSARTQDIIVNDESVYTRSGSAQAWFLRPTIAFPASGTMQYITSRPIFSPSAASSAILYGLNNSPEIGDATANSNNITGEISAARIGWGAFGAGYTGTISKMFGAHIVEPGSAGSATITASAGLAIDNLAVGTNRTLLLIGSTTVPSGIYSIYSPTTKNLHAAGQTFLGSSTSAMTIGGVSNPGVQIIGTDGYAKETIARFSADTTAPAIFFGKSRGTTTLAGAVAANDVLMQINAIGDDGSTNAEIKITGAQITAEVDGAVAAGQVPTRIILSTMNSSASFAERLRLTSDGILTGTGSFIAQNATAIPAGGTAAKGFMFSSTSNFGVFFGSDAPTLSAAKGSLYLRSNGSTTNDRAYINTDGGTTWTPLTTGS